MQFTAPRADLARILSDVAKVVEKRNTIPILGFVKLAAGAGKIDVTGTDLDIEMTRTMGATVAEKGTACLDAARFLAAVSKFAGSEVSFTLDGHEAKLKCGRSRITLPTLHAEDFPSINYGEAVATFRIDLATFFAPVKFAISTEETRYYLNGVFLHERDGTLYAVATDGHRLGKASTAAPEGAAGMPGVIVPRKTVDVLSVFKGEIEVSLSPTKIVLQTDDAVLVSKLIDGTFPDYARVVPMSNDKVVRVSRTDLAGALDRAAVVLDVGRAVKLSIAPGGIAVSVRGDNGNASDDVEAEYSGAPIEVGFNSRYLGDILNVATCGMIQIKLSDPGSPAIIEDPANDNWMSVLMPMRV